ncbi:MAG: TonB-dependent receptor [Campylobacterota bacterium]|nr:TonB-dependent receptor [Campylobacterota bacterium]
MRRAIHYSMAVLMICTATLSAEENNDMEDITVTATQNPELKTYEAPLPVDIVTSAEIEERSISRIEEIFERTPGVDAITAGPGSVMPVIRGLSHEQVLMLVNGVRLSDERPGGNHVLSIDPAQIERVEIVKGPGSVLYGAGAVGGVVNFITRKAPRSESETLEISGEVGAGYETNNNAKYEKAQINASSKDLNLYLGGVNRKTDNIKSPDEEVKFSFYDGYTIWGGGDYMVGNWKTAVNLWQSKADIGITAPRNFLADYYKDETHSMADAKVTYKSDDGGLLEQFDLQAAFQEHNRHRIRQPDADKLVDIHVDKETQTLRGQFILIPNEQNRITTGIDIFDEDLTSSRIMDGYPPVIGKFSGVPVIAPSSRTGTGLFVQDEIDVSALLKVTAGLRYDTIEAQTDGSAAPYFITSPQSDRDSAVSGSIGAVYSFGQTSNVYANIGRAFRAPTLIERYYFGPHDGPAQDHGNPDLDPETSLNTDVGIRFREEEYQASFGLFYNKVDDMIRKILINPSAPAIEQIYQYQNISKATLYGGELDVRYFVTDEWTLFASAWMTKGEDDTHGRPLNAIPPAKASYGVDYEMELYDYTVLLELQGETALKQDDVGIGEKPTSGYTRANFYAYISNDNGLKVSLAVENIFDRTTYDHLSYGWQQLDYASMGRNVKFEVGYRF